MILHEITLAEFMAAHDQQVVDGFHDLHNLFQTLEPPGWFDESVVPITGNPRYATAEARPYKNAALSQRPFANQILLTIDKGRYSLPVGLYLDEVIVIDPSHRRKGLSTELILRCCAHRDVPRRRTLTRAGKAALVQAHTTAVHNADAAGCYIPTAIRSEYGI
jgi:hypothetical protein